MADSPASSSSGRQPLDSNDRPAGKTTGTRVVAAYFEALLIAVLLAVFARTWVLQGFRIPTPSMERTLLTGDHILVNKVIWSGGGLGGWGRLLPVRDVRRGDVVVFRSPRAPGVDFVKRCVALPGDVVEIVDKLLHVDGVPVEDHGYTQRRDGRIFSSSKFLEERFRHRDNFGPYRVPEGQLFVLGDNRDDSNDSRHWGPVPMANLRGRAWMVYWSTAPGPDQGKIGGESTRKARWLGIRWERCFRLVR